MACASMHLWGTRKCSPKCITPVGGGFVCLLAAPLTPRSCCHGTPLPFHQRSGNCSPVFVQRLTVVGCGDHESRLPPTWPPRTHNCSGIWEVMNQCIQGLLTEGSASSGLNVHHQSAGLFQRLVENAWGGQQNRRAGLAERVYAMAVSEENAAGGQVVTAPTNGAAGVLPKTEILRDAFGGSSGAGCDRLPLTAGAIGILYKEGRHRPRRKSAVRGSGVACSMAAGALAAIQGGSPEQIENAAEIGMEHNLGLTCDPIGGLVQIPCIERNTMGQSRRSMPLTWP